MYPATMKTCEYAGPPLGELRSHPWVDSVTDPRCRYYDLKAAPAEIRRSLEDFVPWERHPAIHTFYGLLEHLNGADCALESNDCAFEGPAANAHTAIDKALQCSGRVMVLFRQLERNAASEQIEWLKDELHLELQKSDQAFRWGVIGTTIVPVRYLELPCVDVEQNGEQLMISFWAWGNTEANNMQNLGRLMRNLERALLHVSRHAAFTGFVARSASAPRSPPAL